MNESSVSRTAHPPFEIMLIFKLHIIFYFLIIINNLGLILSLRPMVKQNFSFSLHNIHNRFVFFPKIETKDLKLRCCINIKSFEPFSFHPKCNYFHRHTNFHQQHHIHPCKFHHS